MTCARLEVRPGDSGNTEGALDPVSEGRRGFLLGECTSPLTSDGEVGINQVRRAERYSGRPRGGRHWLRLATVSCCFGLKCRSRSEGGRGRAGDGGGDQVERGLGLMPR